MSTLNSKGFIPEVKILCGLPASGKSSEAKDWLKKDPERRVRINYDDIRLEMFGSDWTWNRLDEEKVKLKAIETFETAMQLGMSVIIDNTNLTKGARQFWIANALKYNIEAEVEEIGSDIPIWDLIQRDKKRGSARVGRAVIERMALLNGFIDWKDKKAYNYDGFIVCDLDGTLCDIQERRKYVTQTPKDWKSFFANVSSDKLNAPVADMLDMFIDDGYGVLLVTGRPIDPCGIATEDWLVKHEIKYDHLFMRNGGDHRSDVIVKQEILNLLPIDRIDYVLEDRNQVVEMWRKNGLFCLQVADGNF